MYCTMHLASGVIETRNIFKKKDIRLHFNCRICFICIQCCLLHRAKYTIEIVSIVFLLLHGLPNRFMIWKGVVMPKKAQKRTGNAKKA